MDSFRLIAALLFVLLLSGCGTPIKQNHFFPPQALDATVEDKTRVVFYNGISQLIPDPLRGLLAPKSMGLKINGIGLATLEMSEYVQLFLAPGDYTLELSYIDVFTSREELDLHVGTGDMFVKVYKTIGQDLVYSVFDAPFDGFEDEFSAVNTEE